MSLLNDAPRRFPHGRAPTCICGECNKCKRAAYMREWYRRPGNAQAQRDSQRASRLRRLEEVRAYDRARGHRVYSEAAEKARRDFSHAIEKGRIKRQPCEVCGQPNAEGHHPDYSRPLSVQWLCRKHHMELHRKVA